MSYTGLGLKDRDVVLSLVFALVFFSVSFKNLSNACRVALIIVLAA